MVKFQKELNLLTETKDIVIVANENSRTKELLEVLEGSLIDFKDDMFITLSTLGKMKAKKVHIIGENKLSSDEDFKKILAELVKLKNDALILIDTFSDTDQEMLVDFVEGLLTKSYSLETFKSKKTKEKANFYIYGDDKAKAKMDEGLIYGESINQAKDLVNTPYNHMKAKDLAEHAKTLEKYDGVSVRVYNKKEIQEMNMGSFLGVNLGSTDEPYLIFIEYKAKGNKDEPVALVGKGVMYDTGGYSLKSPQTMPNMKTDMAGSAAVVSAIEGMARLKLNAHVMSIVAATDNRIGDGALVPDDIITSANGKTIEIISTDAEGRLTLADAVWFAQKQGAKKIIDVATLTGAIVAALGDINTGAFTNNQAFFDSFKEVAEIAKEKVWQMPLSKEHHELLKSKVADLKNSGGRMAGSSTAAAFIEEFIDEDTKWIHLDIAGTASNSKEGATGVMVKSFMKFFS